MAANRRVPTDRKQLPTITTVCTMELLLASHAEDRKARLAALRDLRKGKAAAEEARADTAAAAEAPPAAGSAASGSAASVDPISAIGASAPRAYASDAAAPVLEVSGFETVEVLAAKEQQRILEQLHTQAVRAMQSDVELRPKRARGTEDLERDIQDYLDMARDRTALAIDRMAASVDL
jgi:hypothetical protein